MLTRPEQRLWQHVLLTVLADLQSSSEYRYRDREFARSWVGDYPNRDFQMICDLVGIDVDSTHRYLQRFCRDDQGGPYQLSAKTMKGSGAGAK